MRFDTGLSGEEVKGLQQISQRETTLIHTRRPIAFFLLLLLLLLLGMWWIGRLKALNKRGRERREGTLAYTLRRPIVSSCLFRCVNVAKKHKETHLNSLKSRFGRLLSYSQIRLEKDSLYVVFLGISPLFQIDSDSGKQWRFSEIKGWSEMCQSRLRELGVTATSRVALITGHYFVVIRVSPLKSWLCNNPLLSWMKLYLSLTRQSSGRSYRDARE